jgi:hypothetical protein
MWKKLFQSNDLITYERKFENLKIRIECRKNEDNSWSVFMTYYTKNLNYTEEFSAQTDEELKVLLTELMNNTTQQHQ